MVKRANAFTQQRTPDCARDLDFSFMYRSSHRWQMRTARLRPYREIPTTG